jgi:hypothetical protein
MMKREDIATSNGGRMQFTGSSIRQSLHLVQKMSHNYASDISAPKLRQQRKCSLISYAILCLRLRRKSSQCLYEFQKKKKLD